jgi:hypothetical protein
LDFRSWTTRVVPPSSPEVGLRYPGRPNLSIGRTFKKEKQNMRTYLVFAIATTDSLGSGILMEILSGRADHRPRYSLPLVTFGSKISFSTNRRSKIVLYQDWKFSTCSPSYTYVSINSFARCRERPLWTLSNSSSFYCFIKIIVSN